MTSLFFFLKEYDSFQEGIQSVCDVMRCVTLQR